MSKPVLIRYGEWWVVAVDAPRFNGHTGMYVHDRTVFGSFKDELEARDLFQTLQHVIRGSIDEKVVDAGIGS